MVFQTPTGRLIHSNPGYCVMDACPTQWFQTPTGRLIHSNSESWNAWRHTMTFQTPTGRLIHSNLLVSFLCPSLRLVSNPNGPPHPFQPGVMKCLEASDDVSNPNGTPHPFQQQDCLNVGIRPIMRFQTPTGRLIHSNIRFEKKYVFVIG